MQCPFSYKTIIFETRYNSHTRSSFLIQKNSSSKLAAAIFYFTCYHFTTLIYTNRQCKNILHCIFTYSMIPFLLDVWGCMPELSKNCVDMSNATSTYIGVVAGAVIGSIVSWWIYNRQKSTSKLQANLLNKIKDLEENHSNILKKLEDFDNKHESSFEAIKELNDKIEKFLKIRKDGLK